MISTEKGKKNTVKIAYRNGLKREEIVASRLELEVKNKGGISKHEWIKRIEIVKPTFWHICLLFYFFQLIKYIYIEKLLWVKIIMIKVIY